MLTSMKNMFKVEDLRNKIAFTLFMILLYRLGSHVPVPGIDVSTLQTLKETAGQSGASSSSGSSPVVRSPSSRCSPSA